MMDGMMDGGACGATMAVLWLAALAVLVAAGVLVFKLLSRPGSPPASAGGDALRVLDARYARGEIDRDEYEERRRTLQTGRL